MKKVVMNMFSIAAAAFFLVSMVHIAAAADTSAASKDINKLNAEITMFQTFLV